MNQNKNIEKFIKKEILLHLIILFYNVLSPTFLYEYYL